MAFCEYCPCDDCRKGLKGMYHAQTADGRFVCEICFTYDLCENNEGKIIEPCKDSQCEHRPVLVGGWEEFKSEKLY